MGQFCWEPLKLYSVKAEIFTESFPSKASIDLSCLGKFIDRSVKCVGVHVSKVLFHVGRLYFRLQPLFFHAEAMSRSQTTVRRALLSSPMAASDLNTDLCNF